MNLSAYENTLRNEALNIVTTSVEGIGQSINTLSVLDLGKEVAFSGETVIVYAKGSQKFIYLTLSSNLGNSTTMRFNSIEVDTDIPAGSVILYSQLPRIKKINTSDLYFHQSIFLTAGTNGNDYLSAFGTSAFSVNSATTLADGNSKPNRWASQFSIFVAPNACTLKKIKGTASSDAGSGDDCVISIWTATPNIGATTNLTIDVIHQFTLTSQNNQNHVFDLDQDTGAIANASLLEGDIIFVSIRRTGTLSSGVEWYADLGFEVEMNKKPL